jgi:carboxymethylenebutenolidase
MNPGQASLAIEDRHAAAAAFDDVAKNADAVAAADATEMAAVGIIGFCMGGMYAMKAASTGRFDKVVAFYGMIRVPEMWEGSGQGDAIDHVAARGSTDVMAVMGTADSWTPSDAIDDLEAAGATVIRYEGADHGFVHDPERPAHRADDAADAWSRMIAFLES